VTALTLVAIVPTRGRPQAARDVITAFRHTCEAATRLVFAVDADDPHVVAYQALAETESEVEVFAAPAPSNMVKTLNAAATQYAVTAYALAFMGDDHRPCTPGWDRAYIRALREMGTGIVYGDDLLQGERLPTQVAMTSDIVLTLGHMAPPGLTHLFVDNYWKDLGDGAECLRYLPGVIVEHMHPFAGKAALDEGYHRVNAPAMYDADGAAYLAYSRKHLLDDIEKVRAL
jgi:hypothetical protein